MAFSLGGSGNGNGGLGARRRFHSLGSLSEMNVVPLVDVVLVLLIIFMLTAHVMEFGLDVSVPEVRQTRDTAEELPVVTVTREGEMFLNEAPVNIHALPEELRAKFPQHKAIYVRADKGAIWDVVAQVFGVLGEAKFEVRAVTKPEDLTERVTRGRR
jgi:biopolymer transport protein ExbD